MPSTILSEENAQLEALGHEARALIQDFLKENPTPDVCSPEGQALIHRIFRIFLSQSARFPEPSLFQDWLQQDVALDHPSSEAIVTDIVTLYETGNDLIGLVRKAVEQETQMAHDAIRGLLESYECDEMVHRKVRDTNNEALKSSRFYNLVQNLLEGSAGARAQMIAVFDMYCTAGWAAKDWETALDGSTDPQKPGLKAWVNILRNPQATPAEKVKAFEQRLKELLVDIQVTDRFAGDPPTKVYLATTGKTTKFSFSGKAWGNGAVGLVMPFATDETHLLVAEVMAGHVRFNRSETRHKVNQDFSSIHGALIHGNLSGYAQDGSVVHYKSATYASYLSPLVVAPDDPTQRSELKDALGANIAGMHALNTLQLLVDGYSRETRQFSFDNVIKAWLKPLGAVSHWERMDDSTPAERLTKACEVVVEAAQALDQIIGYGPHADGLHLFGQTNGKTTLAVEALHLAIQGVMSSPEFTAVHHGMMHGMAPALERLIPLLDMAAKGGSARDLEADWEAVMSPFSARPVADTFSISTVLRAAYDQERRQTATRNVFQGLVKKPPFRGYKVHGSDHFVPSETTSIAGALDQIASSTAPAVHHWVDRHATDLAYLGPDQIKQWAQRIADLEGPANKRIWAAVSPMASRLDQVMAAFDHAWQTADLLDAAHETSHIKTLMGQRFVEHLNAGLASGPDYFDTLAERLGHVQRVITARHLDTADEQRKALKERLVQIASACRDIDAVKTLCDHLVQPFDKEQGLPFVQLLGEGRFKDDPLVLPVVRENVPIDPDDLREWVRKAAQPVAAPTGKGTALRR